MFEKYDQWNHQQKRGKHFCAVDFAELILDDSEVNPAIHLPKHFYCPKNTTQHRYKFFLSSTQGKEYLRSVAARGSLGGAHSPEDVGGSLPEACFKFEENIFKKFIGFNNILLNNE